jgi:hypothetical protein
MTRRSKHGSTLDIPLAVGSDGSILVGASHVLGLMDPVDLAEQADIFGGHRVFVGILLKPALRRTLLRDAGDPLVELVARLPLRGRR